jgi:hypothetical protein
VHSVEQTLQGGKGGGHAPSPQGEWIEDERASWSGDGGEMHREPSVGAGGSEPGDRVADSEEMEMDSAGAYGGAPVSSEPSTHDAGVGAVEEALQLFRAYATVEGSESSQDAAHQGATRQVFSDGWKKFTTKAGNGKSRFYKPTVVPTCVIDFPFEDLGGLNLQDGARLLERMYCFKDTTDDERVVLHVHTLLPWGKRGHSIIPSSDPTEPPRWDVKTLKDRAAKVTSVNVRHAARTTSNFSQEGGKLSFKTVPYTGRLKHPVYWRQQYNAGRGTSLEWTWADAKSLPHGEDRSEDARETYAQVLPNPASYTPLSQIHELRSS